MISASDPPTYKTVFDVAPNEVHGYRTLLDHLTEIGMAIVRQAGPPDLADDLPFFDRADAFTRASEAIVVSINLSHVLSSPDRRSQYCWYRAWRVRSKEARSHDEDAQDGDDDFDDDFDDDLDDLDDLDDIEELEEPDEYDELEELDDMLYRPINALFGDACLDLAAAASIIGVPPWIDSTPDYLRSMIVALARRETERLLAAGHDAPAPFSAQILDYKPRASAD